MALRNDAGRAVTSSVVINKPNSSFIVDQNGGEGTPLYRLYRYVQPKTQGEMETLMFPKGTLMVQ